MRANEFNLVSVMNCAKSGWAYNVCVSLLSSVANYGVSLNTIVDCGPATAAADVQCKKYSLTEQ